MLGVCDVFFSSLSHGIRLPQGIILDGGFGLYSINLKLQVIDAVIVGSDDIKGAQHRGEKPDVGAGRQAEQEALGRQGMVEAMRLGEGGAWLRT